MTGQVLVEGLNAAKRHHEAEPAGRTARRHRREGAPARSLPNVMICNRERPEGRSRRLQKARGRRRVRFFKSKAAKSWIDDMTARLHEIYKKRSSRGSCGKARAQESDGRAAGSRRSRSTWASARRVADKKVLDDALGDLAESPARSRVADAGAHQSVASFKVRDGAGDRLQRSRCAAQRIRVPRPSDQRRDAAYPRLPRRERAARSTTPRQLQLGREGTDHFPGDHLRLGGRRCAAWTSRSTTTAQDGRPRSARCSKAFRVPAEERSLMATKSMVMRQKHREIAVKKYAEEAGRAQGAHPQPEDPGRGQDRGAGGAPEDAARRESDPGCAIVAR